MRVVVVDIKYTKKSAAPIQKEGTGPGVLPTKKSTAPIQKEVAGLHKMMGWWF